MFELITTLTAVLPMNIDVTPNDSGLPGIGQLRVIVGAVMTIGLILSVLALIVSAICLPTRRMWWRWIMASSARSCASWWMPAPA